MKNVFLKSTDIAQTRTGKLSTKRGSVIYCGLVILREKAAVLIADLKGKSSAVASRGSVLGSSLACCCMQLYLESNVANQLSTTGIRVR